MFSENKIIVLTLLANITKFCFLRLIQENYCLQKGKKNTFNARFVLGKKSLISYAVLLVMEMYLSLLLELGL